MVWARILKKLWPRYERHFFLQRDLSAPVESVDAAPNACRLVDSPRHPDAGLLRGFCVSAGFGDTWHAEMLALDARAMVVVEPHSLQPMAMAWLIDRAFMVEEIGAIFDPAPGVYLFGDFVLPAFRGRGLQRLLVNQRLLAAQSRPARLAQTIIHIDNIPSLKSYRMEGFAISARLVRRNWLGRWRTRLWPENGSAQRLAYDESGVIRTA